jgi:hypothetical protein
MSNTNRTSIYLKMINIILLIIIGTYIRYNKLFEIFKKYIFIFFQKVLKSRLVIKLKMLLNKIKSFKLIKKKNKRFMKEWFF